MPGFDSSGFRLYANESVRIQGSTRLYGIIGWPVEHSLSPLFQSRFLMQSGLDAAYVPFGVRPEMLQQAMDGLWALNVEGFNVTVPHKQAVLEYVSADDDARLIGAANTVRRGPSGWEATNTDYKGLRSVFEGLKLDLEGASALLFGAGGTARAALHALSNQGLERLYITNRNPGRLALLADFAHASYPHLPVETLPWNGAVIAKAAERCLLVINVTSIGLSARDAFPFAVPGNGFAVDVVYRPAGKTAFLDVCADRVGVDGLPMLIAQGAESFAWWHQGEMPDRLEAFEWMARDLGRQATDLPGWRMAA